MKQINFHVNLSATYKFELSQRKSFPYEIIKNITL